MHGQNAPKKIPVHEKTKVIITKLTVHKRFLQISESYTNLQPRTLLYPIGHYKVDNSTFPRERNDFVLYSMCLDDVPLPPSEAPYPMIQSSVPPK